MSLRGGSADKAGNVYEDYVAILEICYMLKFQPDSYIYFEKPDEIDEGFEFEIGNNNNINYYQVKRESKKWTISRLSEILNNFYQKLDSNVNYKCLLFTTSNTDLDELTHRAEKAIDFKTFSSIINSKTYDPLFSSLCETWELNPTLDNDREKAFNYLKRIDIHIIGEATLKLNVNMHLASLFEEEPDIVRPYIFEKAITSYNKKYTTKQLYEDLGSQFTFLECYKNNSLLSTIEDVNSVFEEKMTKNHFFSQHRIKRNVVFESFNSFIEDDKLKGLFLTGEAGIGKSGSLIDIIDKLKEDNVAYLSISVDTLNATNNPNDIGTQLLKINRSPEIVISNIAQGDKCVLIIDQLDAISTVSGRNTELWNAIRQLIIQGLNIPNLKIIISCRKFDLEKDHRINSFIKSKEYRDLFLTVTVSRLNENEVKDKLKELSININNLSKNHIELYSLPLHLHLLKSISELKQITLSNYNSRTELYNEFWDFKQSSIRERYSTFKSLMPIVTRLIEYLNDNQCLYAPIYHFDSLRNDFDVMVSENIITVNQDQCSFFHETFFDYCFARNFVAQPKNTLLEFLTEQEQSLFIRSQVRQILEFKRASKSLFDSYLKDLNDILNTSSVRFHIKALTLDLLTEYKELNDEELLIIDSLDISFIDKIYQNPRYLKLFLLNLIRKGEFEEYILSEDKQKSQNAYRAVIYNEKEYLNELILLFELMSDKLEPFIESFPNIVTSKIVLNSEVLVDIIIGLIKTQRLETHYLQYIFFKIDEKNIVNIQHFFKIYSAYFALLIDEYRENKDNKVFNILIEHLFSEVIEKYPELFIKYNFQIFLNLLNTAEREYNNSKTCYIYDVLFSYRFYDSYIDSILDYFELAFIKFSENKPDEFINFIDDIKESEFETIQFLILKGLSVLPTSKSDYVISHLLENPERFEIGYSNEKKYPTMVLIKNFSKDCSEDTLNKLIELILNYYTPYEFSTIKSRIEYRKTQTNKWRNNIYVNFYGHSQAKLLASLDQERLKENKKAYHRLKEWERKFCDKCYQPFFKEPEGVTCGIVESPIDIKYIQKMSDKQLKDAIYKHNQSRRDRWDRDVIKGGSEELARAIESIVKDNPRKFYNFIYTLNEEKTEEEYYSNLLDGLKESDLKEFSTEELERIVEFYHSFDNKPFCRSLIGFIKSIIKHDLPISQNILEIVNWYALNDPDPETESEENSGWSDRNTWALNSGRGRAAYLIAQLLWKDYQNYQFFENTIKTLMNDYLPVRAISCEILLPLYNIEKAKSLELFMEVIKGDINVFKYEYVQKYIYQTRSNDNFDFYQAILDKLLETNDETLISFTTKVYSIYSIYNEKACSRVLELFDKGEIYKKAIVEIMSKRFIYDQNPPFCENLLIKLFNDESKDIREKASRCFFKMDDKLFNYENIIVEYISSEAFMENSHDLVYKLKELTINKENEHIVEFICLNFIERIGFEANRFSYDAEILFKIVIDLYVKNKKAETLDIIEKFLELPDSSFSVTFADYERSMKL